MMEGRIDGGREEEATVRTVNMNVAGSGDNNAPYPMYQYC